MVNTEIERTHSENQGTIQPTARHVGKAIFGPFSLVKPPNGGTLVNLGKPTREVAQPTFRNHEK